MLEISTSTGASAWLVEEYISWRGRERELMGDLVPRMLAYEKAS